jgi:hypothetical protein
MSTATAATTALAIGVAVTLLGCAVVLDLTVRHAIHVAPVVATRARAAASR